MCAKSFQLCPTLCDPMDCSPAGSSVHGILQARILEWIAMSHSRVSSQPRDQSCISYMSCVYFNNFFFSFLKSPLSQIRSHSLMSRHHSGHYGHRGRRHNLQGQLVQLHLFLGMHQSRALVLFWYHLSLLWNMPYLAQRSSSSRIHQKVPLSFSSLWEVRRILVKETLLGRAWRKATPVSQALWTSPVSDNLNRNLTDMPGEARL